jgi:hypothetical protein
MASELVYTEVQAELPARAGSGPGDAQSTPEHISLFTPGDADNFRARWRDIQGEFVDEPRHAVEEANELVARAIERLTDVFSKERGKLEQEWGQGKDVSTEDLRQALRRYRSFFDRLLSV